MSRLKIPEPPYGIEGIMEEMGRQIRRPPTAPEVHSYPGKIPVGLKQPLSSEERTLLERVEKAAFIRPDYKIESHRPILGFVIDRIKKLVHWAQRPYMELLIDKQERFNDLMLRFSAGLLERVESVESRVETLSRKLANDRKGLHALLQRDRDRYDLGYYFNKFSQEDRLELMKKFRGYEAEISGRQRIYLDYFRNRPGQILDVGCGRGEFLDLLRHEGIEAWGCETDPMMLEISTKKEVLVRPLGALEALRQTPRHSLGGVFSAQVVEHLFGAEALALIHLASTRIAPGGVFILETLNPQSLAVLAKSYYKDLDHKQPIDPDYLAQLFAMAGFEGVEVHRLAPFEEGERLAELASAEEMGLSPEGREALQRVIDRLNETIWGEQDYYVVGRRPSVKTVAAGPPRMDP